MTSDLDPAYAIALAGSWLAHGMRHSTDPDKVGEAAAILWQAFRKRHAARDKTVVHFNKTAAPMGKPVG